ncbi:AEC family transporter [Anaerotardibacter muris]|uniref:AEC family transporter n=1 Tax=Anaerotardibacter muris TaxID=2941505 RepID=UPI0020402ED5|nr:AEC family transporter [Anaerotardibacter muris]
MEKIIIEDIVPILVIMILGYICGKVTFFDDDQRQGLNKVVLNIALPAALFISIVKASREMLASDLTLTIISIVGIVGMFMLSFFLCRLIFHHTIQEAAVCALIAGSPTIGFLGFAVLDPIYGATASTDLVIGIVSIVVNAITIPIGYYLINVGQQKSLAKAGKSATATAGAGTPATSDAKVPVDEKSTTDKKAEILATSSNKGKAHHAISNPNVAAVVNALKQPVVWAPLLAVVFVLLGIKVPDELDPTFDLIAKANSGLAVLAAGLALSTVKFSFSVETWWNTFFRLVLTPAVFLGAGLLFGMGGDVDKLSMLVMAVALPPAFSGIIISSRYNIYVREGASSVAVSTVAFAVTCILWIWLVPVVVGMV